MSEYWKNIGYAKYIKSTVLIIAKKKYFYVDFCFTAPWSINKKSCKNAKQALVDI